MCMRVNNLGAPVKQVLIIGTYPPPVGGTSVHLQRLYESCKKDGIKSVVYDTASRFKKMPCEDNEVIKGETSDINFFETPQEINFSFTIEFVAI